MSLNVNTTNQISENILKTGVEIGSLSLAAHALDSPLGAAGGAMYGAVHMVTRLSLSWVMNKVLNADHVLANEATKTLHAVTTFFGSHAAAWAALTAAGFAFTAGNIFGIMAFSILTEIALVLLVNCFSPQNQQSARV